ncbi:MAG: hypothetical protein WB341_12215 [Terracidiphilus sp.]
MPPAGRKVEAQASTPAAARKLEEQVPTPEALAAKPSPAAPTPQAAVAPARRGRQAGTRTPCKIVCPAIQARVLAGK